MDLSIFLSYNTQDSEKFHVQEFAQKLTSYDEINEVLYCEEDIQDDFIAYMNECVGKCDLFLLFCSERSISSDFVGIEWRAAMSLGKIIIPIFHDKKYIPPLLAPLIGVDFNEKDIDGTINKAYQLILKKINHYMKQESLTEEKAVKEKLEETTQIKNREIEIREKFDEFISFRGAQIPFYEADFLIEIEILIDNDKNINLINKISDSINLGFTVKNNYIKDLIIRNNKLTKFPDSIGDLKSLEQLYLDNNNLIILPDTIGNLSSLKILNLGNNSLGTLPDSIINLTSLQKLYLDNNLITILPESIEKLNSLRLLTFGNKTSKSIKESHKLKKILKKLENKGVTILKKL